MDNATTTVCCCKRGSRPTKMPRRREDRPPIQPLTQNDTKQPPRESIANWSG